MVVFSIQAKCFFFFFLSLETKTLSSHFPLRVRTRKANYFETLQIFETLHLVAVIRIMYWNTWLHFGTASRPYNNPTCVVSVLECLLFITARAGFTILWYSFNASGHHLRNTIHVWTVKSKGSHLLLRFFILVHPPPHPYLCQFHSSSFLSLSFSKDLTSRPDTWLGHTIPMAHHCPSHIPTTQWLRSPCSSHSH